VVDKREVGGGRVEEKRGGEVKTKEGRRTAEGGKIRKKEK